MFRTRFAPSPTGYLHLGSARTTLFAKLLAVHNQGVFFLRLEDTDRQRLQPDAFTNLLQALNMIGLQSDEGVTLDQRGDSDYFYGVFQSGDVGPYIQSERLSIYHHHAQQLLDRGLAYWSFLTPADKEELQQIKQIHKRPINYFKANSDKFDSDRLQISIAAGLADPDKPALMFRLQRNEVLTCHDELLGDSQFDLNLEEDFVILKSDGYPTYHLAHLIDDQLMQTSLIVRSQEWLPSIAKHVAMFRDYWGEVPKYMHLPVVLGETGNKKMSKRDGNVNLQDYLDLGYLPEAILNYLAFLGFNPGTEQELYLTSTDFQTYDVEARIRTLISNIAADFSLDKLSKSPARFNLEKLNWFNREYIKMLSLSEFAHRASATNINRRYPDQTLRVGDYAYLVDIGQQQVFMEQTGNISVGHNQEQFYPLGGGREAGETSVAAVTREVWEETQSQLRLQPELLVPLTDFQIKFSKPSTWEGVAWGGKEMHVYFYSVPKADLKPCQSDVFGCDWIDLATVIETNKFITYPIWQAFCERRGLACFEPTDQIVQQYLAWSLDQNRITTLSELGADSSCILDWSQPVTELVQWKKISLKESLANLREIAEVIFSLVGSQDISDLQLAVYQTAKTDLESYQSRDLHPKLQTLAGLWEVKIKEWLVNHSKDTGSYLWPLRVGLSGKAKSPSPFELLTILRPDQIKQRIDFILN